MYGIPGALIGYVVVGFFLAGFWRIETDAVPEGVSVGERVLVARPAYGVPIPFIRLRLGNKGPERGDMVAYRAPKPGKHAGRLLVGRVAGLPGDMVRIEDDTVFVDNVSVGLRGDIEDGADWLAKRKTKVPEDHYLVLAEGIDSRTVGWTSSGALLGRVAAVWWPVWRMRRVGRLVATMKEPQ